jgi:hypothetical protein
LLKRDKVYILVIASPKGPKQSRTFFMRLPRSA